MNLGFLSETSAEWIVLCLMAGMLIFGEIAYSLGRRLASRAPDAGKGHFGAIQGSLLGLLALLLSFTFNMSAQRFDNRRQLMVEDTSNLHALYLRIDLLPAPHRAQLKNLLRQYVDLRANPQQFERNLSPAEIQQAYLQSLTLWQHMWTLSKDLSQQSPPVKGSDEILRLLIDGNASTGRRLFAYASRVPDPVLLLLLGASLGGICVIGFSAGLGNHRGIPARLMLTLLVCGTIYILLDLDRPRSGIIKIDQGPMIQLRQIIDADPEST